MNSILSRRGPRALLAGAVLAAALLAGGCVNTGSHTVIDPPKPPGLPDPPPVSVPNPPGVR